MRRVRDIVGRLAALLGFPGDPREDAEVLALLAVCFEQPAFTAPFTVEGNPHELLRAVEETLKALDTGVLLDRGVEVFRGRSRHDLERERVQDLIGGVVLSLQQIRTLLRKATSLSEITRLAEGGPRPTFPFDTATLEKINGLRERLLGDLRQAMSDAGVRARRG